MKSVPRAVATSTQPYLTPAGEWAGGLAGERVDERVSGRKSRSDMELILSQFSPTVARPATKPTLATTSHYYRWTQLRCLAVLQLAVAIWPGGDARSANNSCPLPVWTH